MSDDIIIGMDKLSSSWSKITNTTGLKYITQRKLAFNRHKEGMNKNHHASTNPTNSPITNSPNPIHRIITRSQNNVTNDKHPTSELGTFAMKRKNQSSVSLKGNNQTVHMHKKQKTNKKHSNSKEATLDIKRKTRSECPSLPPTPQPINGDSFLMPNEAADYLLSIDDKIRSHMRKKLVKKVFFQ